MFKKHSMAMYFWFGVLCLSNDLLFAFVRSTVSDDFCQGKDPKGYYADPDNCASFMRCPPGYDNPTHQNCAPGTLWEPQTSDSGVCNYANQVDCGERPSKLVFLLYAHQRKTELLT